MRHFLSVYNDLLPDMLILSLWRQMQYPAQNLSELVWVPILFKWYQITSGYDTDCIIVWCAVNNTFMMQLICHTGLEGKGVYSYLHVPICTISKTHVIYGLAKTLYVVLPHNLLIHSFFTLYLLTPRFNVRRSPCPRVVQYR